MITGVGDDLELGGASLLIFSVLLVVLYLLLYLLIYVRRSLVLGDVLASQSSL